jgi:hypothetical protein
VYSVAVLGALPWLLVSRAVRAGRRAVTVLTVVVITVTVAPAVLLLVSAEYGTQIFPPLWGVLAILPPAAGTYAVVLLFRRRQ